MHASGRVRKQAGMRAHEQAGGRACEQEGGRACGHVSERAGAPHRKQRGVKTGAITVWYSSKFPRLYSLYVRSIHQHGFRTAKRYFGRRPRILAVLSAYFLVVYRSAKVTCTTQKKKVRLVPKMSTLEEWSGLKNTLNKSMCCIKDACFSLGSADPTPHA